MKRWLVAFLSVGLLVSGPWALASADDDKDKEKIRIRENCKPFRSHLSARPPSAALFRRGAI